MKVWASLVLVTVYSAGGSSSAPATPVAEASVVYRNEATKRFEVPSAEKVKEMAARAGGEASAAGAVEELAALGLREEAVAVSGGGVKLRLLGGLRSALLAEERYGKVVFSCEGAPAEEGVPLAASSDGGEVRP